MKALLIVPFSSDLIHAVSVPLGLISIGTYLNANGHEAKIIDLSVSRANIHREIQEFQPDIVGVTLGSVKQLNGALHITKKIKSRHSIPIVWGGSFCDTADGTMLLRDGGADYISLSEGEATWLDMMNRLQAGESFDDCAGIEYLKGGKLVVTQNRPFVDLTQLPELDYSLVDVPRYKQYLYGCNNVIYVYLSKGCPAKCTFCLNAVSHRYQYRRRSLEQFMHETHVLVEKYDVDGLYFCDELCFFNKQQVYEVCDAFDASGLDFRWGFQTRVGILGEEEFQRAYDSGARWVDFGIESGNKERLEKMNKKIPYDRIEPTFEICERVGLVSMANFIIGIPGETEAQVRDTIAMAKRIHATQCSVFKYCLAPKTEMGQEAVHSDKMKHPFKKIKDYRKVDFYLNRTDNFSNVPRKELDVIQSYFLWQALFRKEYGEKTRPFDLFYKHVLTIMRRARFLNFSSFISSMAELVYLSFRFFADTHFHPGIVKKYELKS